MFSVDENIEDNEFLNTYLLSTEATEENKINSNFQVFKNIINNGGNFFYNYQGSLTTPPCSQEVDFFIFPKVIPISKK